MKKLKVYQCEFDGRYAYGIAVVAAYNQHQARKLAKERLAVVVPYNFNRMLISEVIDLAYTGPTPSTLVCSHYVK